MKGTITITLEDGTVFSGNIIGSFEQGTVSPREKSEDIKSATSGDQDLDFSIPLRPFMNTYANAKMSGSKKFALLVAHFVKGELDVPVNRTEVIDAWNKMTALMGGKFNGAHESRAKDAGYIYVPWAGTVALLKGWSKVMQ